MFSTWCAKVIALIGKLPGTLADRSVEIRMQRKPPGATVERLRMDTFDASAEHRQAVRWTSDHAAELAALGDPSMPAGLNDRSADNWRPLLAVADVAGGRWPEAARRACVQLTRTADDGDKSSWGTMLLADLRDVFDEADEESVSSSAAVEALNAMEHRPWVECSRGRKPLTVTGLSTRLDKYGIKPQKLPRTPGGKQPRGYFRADFADAWTRYAHAQGPDSAVSPVSPVSPGASTSVLNGLEVRRVEEGETDEPSQRRTETDG